MIVSHTQLTYRICFSIKLFNLYSKLDLSETPSVAPQSLTADLNMKMKARVFFTQAKKSKEEQYLFSQGREVKHLISYEPDYFYILDHNMGNKYNTFKTFHISIISLTHHN